MTSRMVRVFVNAFGCRRARPGRRRSTPCARGTRTRRTKLATGGRVITDSRGLPIDGSAPMSAGSILRVIVRRDRAPVRRRRTVVTLNDDHSLRACFAGFPRRSCTVTSTGPCAPRRCSSSAREYQPADAAPTTPTRLRDYMRVDDARSLEDYLARFDVTLSVYADRGRARAHRVRARRSTRRATACGTSRSATRRCSTRVAGSSLERSRRGAAARARTRRARRRRDGSRHRLRAPAPRARRVARARAACGRVSSTEASSASTSPAAKLGNPASAHRGGVRARPRTRPGLHLSRRRGRRCVVRARRRARAAARTASVTRRG